MIINIQISDNDNFSFEDGELKLVFKSIDGLKMFLSDPKAYLVYDKCINKIKRDMIEMNSFAGVKKEKTINEINEKIKEFDDSYKKFIDGDYELFCYYVDKESKVQTKEIIELLKDKIKYIYVEKFNFNDLMYIFGTMDISDNVNIITKYNYGDSITKTELLEINDYLNNIKELINRYGLSPLEICIFVNDLIREREYKKNPHEKNLDSKLSEIDELNTILNLPESRSISKVIKSDRIVCAGFSELYSAILDVMGINSKTLEYSKTNSRTGHMTNLVYLNDPKYDVVGLFEIDTTWGRYYNSDGSYNYQKSINNYNYFCRPLDEATENKRKNKLILSNKQGALPEITRLERSLIILESQAPAWVIARDLDNVMRSCVQAEVNLNSNFLESQIKIFEKLQQKIIKDCSYDYNEVRNLITDLKDYLLYSVLDEDAFREALYRVRLVEHSIDKNKYPFEEDKFNKAVESRMSDDIMDVLKMMGGYEQKDFGEDERLDIARAKLISVFHRIANDEVYINPTLHKR